MCHDEDMEKTNALKLRQSLGKVLQRLQKTGQPILVEKDRKPVAVLISLEDFQNRFVDKIADAARSKIIDHIRSANLKLGIGNSKAIFLQNRGREVWISGRMRRMRLGF